MPSPLSRFEPEDRKCDEEDVDGGRLAECARGDNEQPGPEPLLAKQEQDGRGEGQHHEDLGVGGQQARVSRRSQEAVEKSSQDAGSGAGEVAGDREDDQAGRGHGDESDGVDRIHLVGTE